MIMKISDLTIDTTILPPNAAETNDLHRLHELERLQDLMARTSDLPKLLGLDAEPVVLPEDLYHLLQDVISALVEGLPVRVDARRNLQIPTTPLQISTSQAAEILGVSRATMVRFLDDGRLPFTQPGKHRRLLLADVMEFKKNITHDRHAAASDIQSMTSELFDEDSSSAT